MVEIESVLLLLCILVFRLLRMLVSEWFVDKCGKCYYYGNRIYEISVFNV